MVRKAEVRLSIDTSMSGGVGANMGGRQPEKSGRPLIRARRHHRAAGGAIADRAPDARGSMIGSVKCVGSVIGRCAPHHRTAPRIAMAARFCRAHRLIR